MKVALVGLDGQTVPSWVHGELADHDAHLVAWECTNASELLAVAKDAEIIWVFGGNPVLLKVNVSQLPNCCAILRTGTGVDNVPVAEAIEAGILVATTPSAGTSAVAEHAAAMILDQLRQLSAQDRLMREGAWDRSRAWPRWQLQGQVLGLVGFGSTARALVSKLRGFDLQVLAFDPYVAENVFADRGVASVPLASVLQAARVVSLHCSLTSETYHLIGEAELRLMRSDAALVNIARGPLIDQNALIRALEEGWIASAGLDVYETEPLDTDSKLMKLDNTVLTPHIAGYSDVFFDESWRLSVETVIDLAHGDLPRSYLAPRDDAPRAPWQPKTLP